jgi:hypothetical protein
VLASALLEFHHSWAWFIIVTNALAGIWALVAHWWWPARRRELWWLTAVAEIAIVLQVSVGVWLLTRENLDAPQFHEFYGFVGFASVAIIYAYRQQLESYRYLLYGFGSLFLMGIGLRAVYLA